MRTVFAVLAATSLLVTVAQAEPLAAGRPAGVRAARLEGWDAALLIGTGAVILAGVGILVGGNSSAIATVEHFDSNAVPFQPNNNTIPSTGTN